MVIFFSIIAAVLTNVILYIIDNEDVNKWVLLFYFISIPLLGFLEFITQQNAENNWLVGIMHQALPIYLGTCVACGVFLDVSIYKK